MALTLHMHPLSSYCQKVLVALYENDTPFAPKIVDLGDEASRAEFLRVWPVGKFPVLHDDARDALIPESSVIIEYLARYHPGPTALVPSIPTWRGKRGSKTASSISTSTNPWRRS